MNSIILYAPHLGRNIGGLQRMVPNTIVLVGQKTERGEDGCLESHKTAIRTAITSDYLRLFVMEDDCHFTRAFNWERWISDADWAEAHGYDVMAGGCTRTYDEKLVREGMIEVSAFHSAHCVVYFKSGYEKALNAVQPYDVSLGRDCGMRCVLVHPFVAVQKPSYSGILQQEVDYVPLYQDHERILAMTVVYGWRKQVV